MFRRLSLAVAVVLALMVLGSVHSQEEAQGSPRFFPRTGFSVADDRIWSYFERGAGVNTFGYPVSNQFTLEGSQVQIFQRHVLQIWADGSVHPLNLLDPDVLPLTTLGAATFPDYDRAVASRWPDPAAPDYAQAVLDYLNAMVPDQWDGQLVSFRATYLAPAPVDGVAAVDVWGPPTSLPAYDPDDPRFIYQRFERGILRYDSWSGFTSGVPLGEAFASVLRGDPALADLAPEVSNSRYWAHYDPAQARALARPEELPNTDLSAAFDASSSPSTGGAQAPIGAEPAIPAPAEQSGAAEPEVPGGSAASSTRVPATVVPGVPFAGPTATPTPLVIVISLPSSSPTPTRTSSPTAPPIPTATPVPSPTAPGPVIQSGQTVTGTLPAGGSANWYFYGASGQTVIIRMNATSTTLDPYLELYNPSGGLATQDDDSGGGFNAAIINYRLAASGWFRIRASAVGVSNGGYTLAVTVS